MSDIKYVIVAMLSKIREGEHISSTEAAIIFDATVVHSRVIPNGMVAISAGFLIIGNSGIRLDSRCYGESVSLGLKSNPKKIVGLLTVC